MSAGVKELLTEGSFSAGRSGLSVDYLPRQRLSLASATIGARLGAAASGRRIGLV